MASSGVPGFSTLLIWNYHRILEMLSIGGPSQSRDVIDVTSHDSPNNYREFVAGPASGGEISIDGNLIVEDALGQMAFYTDLQAGTKRTVWIVMPMAVGASLLLEAIAKSFSPSAPHEDKVSVASTLQITGKPTLYVTQSAGMSGLTGIEENEAAALSITPAIAVGTYAYACTVNTASSWVKLTPVAAAHTIYVQGVVVVSGEQSGEIALGDAGETTEVFIMAYEAAKSPRLYVLTVTRP